MYHLAILQTKGDWLKKIIDGKKTIESRWYKNKRSPYKQIAKDDIVYFKESGKQVTIKSKVSQVLFFEDLDEDKIKSILEEYGELICLPVSYARELKGKNYCTLIFLENVEQIEPFSIDKTGYGMMSAWITLEDINQIRK
tara:strand:- start:7467 stop:7886 length:420 start_codon:yes stop_codon:yes gene_type:complete